MLWLPDQCLQKMLGSAIVEKRKLTENDRSSKTKPKIVTQMYKSSCPKASSVTNESSGQVVTEPIATASTPSCPNVSRSRTGTEIGEPATQGLGNLMNFAIRCHENTAEASEISGQPIGEGEEFASSTDPILIRREQTRFRVQRYRARQHKLRFEAAAATWDNLDTVEHTGQDDVLSGLQDLTIDEAPQPKVPTGRSPDTSTHDTESRTIQSGSSYQTERTDSNLSEDDPSWSCNSDADQASPDATRTPSRSGSHPVEYSYNSIRAGIDRFSRAIQDQASEARIRTIDRTIPVYDRMFKLFFNPKCSCETHTESEEPSETHSLVEKTQHLQSMLPNMTDMLGGNTSYDPGTYFPKWKSFLSQPSTEPLSFEKAQSTLPTASVTVTRFWDIDSIWLGARSLEAIRPPNDFRISFLPPYALHHSRDQTIRPHGLNIVKTRHIHFGTFNTSSVRFTAFVLFPNAAQGSISSTSASENTLSLERQKDFYDQIVIPAVYETIPDPFRQEIPQSYDMVYAKSRSFEEKVGNNRWGREDQSRALRLEYKFPALSLGRFWGSVVNRANSTTISTRRGSTVPYFRDPQLLFQAHDLKNT
ncbi:hypothetical protein FOVSG1_013369 [Fusarium oxysporum f. sp. vasinfectum]